MMSATEKELLKRVEALEALVHAPLPTSNQLLDEIVKTLTAQHTAPTITIHNTTEEDTDGGRITKIIFKGEQSGGELTTLAMITASHEGVGDDEEGQLAFYVNDGNDGDSPTLRAVFKNGAWGFGESDPSSSYAGEFGSHLNVTGDIYIDDVKVLDAQGTAIASPSTTTVTDPADSPADADALRDDLVANAIAEIETALNNLESTVDQILIRMRNHGLIAT